MEYLFDNLFSADSRTICSQFFGIKMTTTNTNTNTNTSPVFVYMLIDGIAYFYIEADGERHYVEVTLLDYMPTQQLSDMTGISVEVLTRLHAVWDALDDDDEDDINFDNIHDNINEEQSGGDESMEDAVPE